MSDNGNKNNKTAPMNLGEISTIRDILMGSQMNEYDHRFSTLEAKIAEVTEMLEAQIDAASNKAASDTMALEKSVNDQLISLENAIGKKLDQLDSKLLQTSKKDKAKIGKMLADMGRKLMEE